MDSALEDMAFWHLATAQDAVMTVNYNGFGPANASGQLLSSLAIRETRTGYNIVATGPAAKYVSTLRYGRRAGGYVPPTLILNWMKQKNLWQSEPMPVQKRIAFFIAKKIRTKGNFVHRNGLAPTTIWDNLVTPEARQMVALAYKKMILA